MDTTKHGKCTEELIQIKRGWLLIKEIKIEPIV